MSDAPEALVAVMNEVEDLALSWADRPDAAEKVEGVVRAAAVLEVKSQMEVESVVAPWFSSQTRICLNPLQNRQPKAHGHLELDSELNAWFRVALAAHRRAIKSSEQRQLQKDFPPSDKHKSAELKKIRFWPEADSNRLRCT